MTATTVLSASLSDRLQDLIHSPGVPPLAFVLAFAAGAGHAVAPGHGKSLAAAYLAGSRGRIRDAAWLGGSVAVMHTLSVLVIGVAWTFLSLSEVIRMQELTSWLQLGAGLIVLATGLWMVRRHLHAAGHSHSHEHGHGHGHSHDHEHGKRPGLLLLGISGGLTPSPGRVPRTGDRALPRSRRLRPAAGVDVRPRHGRRAFRRRGPGGRR
ncbi:hypothetical protein [Micromonospora sp. NPDC048898]|uniref:HoxN/HupN/NixA family nickel/cobalt transporter n=1 Tax=Micromonospora sp. NPDC048898 TaxID=3364260 RepID=UPI003724AA76